jgi:hypothetical protein
MSVELNGGLGVMLPPVQVQAMSEIHDNPANQLDIRFSAVYYMRTCKNSGRKLEGTKCAWPDDKSIKSIVLLRNIYIVCANHVGRHSLPLVAE